MSIGERVREARREAGITQKELAVKAGMKQPSISELENGESAGTANIATIAAALGVLPLWLQTGKGPKKPTPGTTPFTDDSDTQAVELAKLIAAWTKCDPEWKKKVLDLAATGASYSQGIIDGNPR